MSGIDRQVLVGESVQTCYHLGEDLAVESRIADGRPLQESLSPVSARNELRTTRRHDQATGRRPVTWAFG